MAERLSAGEKRLRSITEAEWQSHVISLARLYGWAVYHPPANRPGRNGKVQQVVAGWPDLAILKDGHLIMAELKTRTGKTTGAQDWWLAELSKVEGVETYVWRPGDDDKVIAILRRARRTR